MSALVRTIVRAFKSVFRLDKRPAA